MAVGIGIGGPGAEAAKANSSGRSRPELKLLSAKEKPATLTIAGDSVGGARYGCPKGMPAQATFKRSRSCAQRSV